MIVSNNKGGFFVPPFNSRFQGFFLKFGDKTFKFLDEVSSSSKLDFFVHDNCLVVSSSVLSSIDLFFDVREIYDNDGFGRFYDLMDVDGNLVVHFKKFSGDSLSYSFFVVIPDVSFKKVDSWVKRDSSFDSNRNSPPFERYVFHAVSFNSKKFVVSVASDLDSALSSALKVSRLKKKDFSFKPSFNIRDKDVKRAYLSSVFSLNQLSVDNGILAGFPWFFQSWTRDELISSVGFLKLKKSSFVRDIVFKNLSFIMKDGRLENITDPSSGVSNADSVGWLFFRASQLRLSSSDKRELSYSLQYCIFELFKNYSRNNLIFNDSKETWMDTQWDYDSRSGFRIEIQALFLHMLRFAYQLSGKNRFLELEYGLKFIVRNAFFKDGYLWDGLDDSTVRPNLFIAAYVYPDLLDKDEWVDCFESVLPSLWLDWGGLSSIDKSHPLFCDFHTGEDVCSYHRGDSWFWLNNLSAIVLHRVDKKRFKDYIFKILSASAFEINNLGLVGCHSELSSASSLSSHGCLSQAWSLALFIELVHELYS